MLWEGTAALLTVTPGCRGKASQKESLAPFTVSKNAVSRGTRVLSVKRMPSTTKLERLPTKQCCCDSAKQLQNNKLGHVHGAEFMPMRKPAAMTGLTRGIHRPLHSAVLVRIPAVLTVLDREEGNPSSRGTPDMKISVESHSGHTSGPMVSSQ